MDIGGNLKKLRLKKGMEQPQLAKLVGVNPSMICQVERGTKTLTIPLGQKIAEVLNCSLNDFIN